MKKLVLFSILVVIGLFAAQVAFSQVPAGSMELANKWDIMKVEVKIADANKRNEIVGVAADTLDVSLGAIIDPTTINVFRQGLFVPKSTLVFTDATTETVITFPTSVASTEVIVVVK